MLVLTYELDFELEKGEKTPRFLMQGPPRKEKTVISLILNLEIFNFFF